MAFEDATDDQAELARLLETGELVPLRDRFDKARRVKQILAPFTSRVWLFPFGVQPSPDHAVEVFRNGMSQYMGEECRVSKAGSISVVVFAEPLHEGDRVQASYIAVPTEAG